jgi:1-acyl-sn-glycerol-3-phosphate acyltransferase
MIRRLLLWPLPVIAAVLYLGMVSLLAWALRVLIGGGRRLFSLEIEVGGEMLPAALYGDVPADVPIVVMSRHAGPADSLLLLNEVMSSRGRRPRIVAKDLLQSTRPSISCSTGSRTGSSHRVVRSAPSRRSISSPKE